MKNRFMGFCLLVFSVILGIIFSIIGIVVYVGVPIAGLYIVYCIAKYLFTGVW